MRKELFGDMSNRQIAVEVGCSIVAWVGFIASAWALLVIVQA